MGNSFFVFMMGAFAVMVLFAGGLSAAMPWLMRRRECFAVTIPETAQRDPRIVALKKRYTAIMVVITVVATVFVAAVPLAMGPARVDANPGVLTVVVLLATLVPVVSSFAPMLHYRKKVAALKLAEGWVSDSAQTAAVVSATEFPRAVSLWWNLLYVPVIALTAGIAVIAYPHMPDLIPMHADFSGNVTDWQEKSPGQAAFPVFIQLFLAATFVFSHWIIVRSKAPVNPDRPAASAYAYGAFARAQSIYLIASGLLLSAVLGIVFELSSLGTIELGVAGAAVVIAVIPMLVGAVAISAVYGQAGARMFARMADKDGLPMDDDEHWKLGIFYFNREDASLFLPERFGIGWTMNLGRPAAWVLIVALVALTALFVAGAFALAG